jgi:hypothetical protein
MVLPGMAGLWTPLSSQCSVLVPPKLVLILIRHYVGRQIVHDKLPLFGGGLYVIKTCFIVGTV